MLISGDTFINNHAVRSGGALYLNWESFYAVDSNFTGSSAKNGGAIYFVNVGKTNLIRIFIITYNRHFLQ